MDTANNSAPQYWCFVCEKEFLPGSPVSDDDVFCPTCQNIAAEIDPENDPRGTQSSTSQSGSTQQSQPTNNRTTNPLLSMFAGGLGGNLFSNADLSPEEQLQMIQTLLAGGGGGIHGGGGAPAAAKDVINRLKQSLFRAEKCKTKECAICQEDYKEMDKMVTMPCDHLFHKDCAITWLNLHNTCPSCRKPLNHITEKPSYDYFS